MTGASHQSHERTAASRAAVGVALAGLVLVSLAFSVGAMRGGQALASVRGEGASQEVTMHVVFPAEPSLGLLTLTLYLIDDGGSLAEREAEGRAAMLLRFPGGVELNDAGVAGQFNISDNVRWPGLGASWYYNASGLPAGVAAGTALSAIGAGADGWANAGGSGWKYTFAGATTAATGCNGVPGSVPKDGLNVVGWGHIVDGYWGYTCWWRSPAKVAGTSYDALEEFDIIFETGPGIPYSPGTLRALALHEFGHALGLGHTQVALCPGHVMCAGSGATSLLALTADEIAGVLSLYGVPPTPVRTPSATVSPTPTPPLFPDGPQSRNFLPGVSRD